MGRDLCIVPEQTTHFDTLLETGHLTWDILSSLNELCYSCYRIEAAVLLGK